MDKATGRYYLSWLIKESSVKGLEIATQIGEIDSLQDADTLRIIENLITGYQLSPQVQRFLFHSAVAHKKAEIIKIYVKHGFDTSNEIAFTFKETNEDVRPAILIGQAPPIIRAILAEQADV